MDWNWTQFFNKITDIQKLKLAVENKGNYTDHNVSVHFLETDIKPVNLLYSAWSKNYFSLISENSQISIDKKYLCLFIEDVIKERDFYKTHSDKSKFEYVTYSFFLDMYLARNISSGIVFFKESLQKLISLVKTKEISIQGSPLISSENLLEEFLKNEFPGFTSLESEVK